MQRNRGARDPFSDFGDPFAGFGGIPGPRNLLSSFFGGRDPFDDPFFTCPFGGMFESSIFSSTGNPFTDARPSGFLQHQISQPNRSRGPIIEELNSDDEGEQEVSEEKKDNPRKHGRSSNEPYIEQPDDEAEGRKSKQMQYTHTSDLCPQTRSFTFQSSRVSYGGANGAYYTSRTRRMGSDGLTFEEKKEADTASGEAAHQISRGIHDKGRTVVRKLNSDGRVDAMQTLHNLNEEELPGFEEAWKGNAGVHMPRLSEGFNAHNGSGTGGVASRGVWALPSTEGPQPSGAERAGPSESQHPGRMRADVGDRRGSARGRARSSTTVKMDRGRRH